MPISANTFIPPSIPKVVNIQKPAFRRRKDKIDRLDLKFPMNRQHLSQLLIDRKLALLLRLEAILQHSASYRIHYRLVKDNVMLSDMLPLQSSSL
jgi:hypothetical protein